MPAQSKSVPRTRSIRQSVTIPAALAAQVRRVATERHLTVSRALVVLAERGIQAERDARRSLKNAYQRFMREQDPDRKNEAGRDLVRTIFGMGTIADANPSARATRKRNSHYQGTP